MIVPLNLYVHSLLYDLQKTEGGYETVPLRATP